MVGMIGRPYAVKWVAVLLLLASPVLSSRAWASNPWGRAVGEAQGLQHVTEDLRNRAHRLFPHSPATRLTCLLDETACRLLEFVKCGAEWRQLQAGLSMFSDLQARLCREVAADCHMSRDRATANYLRMIDDRYRDLVRDLSKCKPPMPGCRPAYPYPPLHHPAFPIPEPYTPIPDPYAKPSLSPYWQGSFRRDLVDPRSTYDFEPHSSRAVKSQSKAGRPEPLSRPVVSEVLNLLLSRSFR